MNTALLFATVVAVLVCGAFSDHHVGKKVADKPFLMKQKNILGLVHRIHQDNVFKEQVDVGNTYDIEAHISNYKNTKVVKEFISYYKKGMLQRWEPFSVYYKTHLEQAISLFELFYFANDFDTFYKTACWARDRVNPLMFWYSFTAAVLHRDDTTDVMMPPPYEVYPYFFVDSDIIQKAYKYWMMHVGTPEHHTYIIPMNHTMKSKENLLYYFTEDVGLNAFNMYYRMYYPSWFNVTEYGHKFDRRGEMFLYVQHQLYARYSLERMSNGMPEVQPFVYNKPLKTAYNPNLMYHTGQEMPPRPSDKLVTNFDTYTIADIKNYERRVADAIDFGYVKDEHLKIHSMYEDNNGIDYLGQMIEGSYNSPHYYYYGSLFHFYRMMLGHMMDPFHKHGLAPSALEQPETALRDPAYYQLHKRIYHLVNKYKDRLPRYTHEQLWFEGVKVENVDVGKMYTYMENFEFSLGGTIYVAKEEDMLGVNLHVRQPRLNHKPFTYKIEVHSEKAVDAYVRVFLGPKHNYLDEEWDLNERRHFFVEMDRFRHHVPAGNSVIERNSHDSSIISPTPDSYRTFVKKVQDAYDGKTQYFIDKSHNYCGFPENLLLPKGQKGGETFTFYVIITPYVKQDEHDFEPYDYKAFSYCGVGQDRKYPDDMPLGFPFDRQIHSKDFYTTNMYFKDVQIFHKKLEEVSTPTH